MVQTKSTYISIVGSVAVFLAAFIVSTSRPVAPSVSAQAPVRRILAEQFTGTWCPYCPGSSGALERAEAQLGKENLIVLAYHSGDRFATSETEARVSEYRISGFPTVVFNGLFASTGGSANPNEPALDGAYSAVMNISKQRPELAQVALTGTLVEESPALYYADFEAVVTTTGPITVPSNIKFALYEDDINFRAQNGETHFDWVVRKMQISPLTITEPGQQETFKGRFDINPQVWNRQHLGIVAFIQNTARRPEVYGVGQINLQ